MGLCLLRGDVKHDARCGLASSICGYSRIAVDRLEWFQTLGRLLCYVDFSLCANRNRIPNDPVASKDRRQGIPSENGSRRTVNGSINRMTSDTTVISAWQNPTTGEVSFSAEYTLKCRPAQRMF